MTIKYKVHGVPVSIDGKAVVELPPRVFRGRLTGDMFEVDKAFLLPSAMLGLRGLVKFCQDHATSPALLLAHTDSAGSPAASRALCADRAEVVQAFLTKKPAAWKRFFGSPSGSLRWRTREDQHMLSLLADAEGPFWPYEPTGTADEVLAEAVKLFQTWAGIAQSGTCDDATRAALIEKYMGQPGTKLPDATALQLHACGEGHPEVEPIAGIEQPVNRRFELFLFEGDAKPAPPATCPDGGCAERDVWLERMVLTVELEDEAPEYLDAFLEIELVDEKGNPIPNEAYEVTAPDGTLLTGAVDDKGKARVEPIVPGLCQVRFPGLDHEEWDRDAEGEGAAAPAATAASPAPAAPPAQA